MVLIALLIVPVLAGVFAFFSRSPQAWERWNLLAFLVLALLALKLGADVLAHGTVTALGGSLRADALSALVVGLTTFVALACALYAIGYFRHDLAAGRITERQLRRYYVLTPLFVAVMLLVPLADNLGVMWVATEGTTLASVRGSVFNA